MHRVFLFALIAVTLVAAEKKPLPGKDGNEKLDIEATAIIDKDEIKSILGLELDPAFVLVKVRITPKEEAIKIWLDDFYLFDFREGSKSQPFQPGQIAGKGKMVVSTVYSGSSGHSNRPTWGVGMGGMGSGVGNGQAQGTAKAKIESGAAEKDNPLLAALKEKVLKEVETKETVTGYLYFSLEGKKKLKDLELYYKSPQQGKLTITFSNK